MEKYYFKSLIKNWLIIVWLLILNLCLYMIFVGSLMDNPNMILLFGLIFNMPIAGVTFVKFIRFILSAIKYLNIREEKKLKKMNLDIKEIPAEEV